MADASHGNRKPGPLNLDIYSALLGWRPRIAPREPTPEPQRRRTRGTVRVAERGAEPLVDAALREQVAHGLGRAARVLADVRARLVGVFQESTIGRVDRRPRPRVEVTIADAVRRRDGASRAPRAA